MSRNSDTFFKSNVTTYDTRCYKSAKLLIYCVYEHGNLKSTTHYLAKNSYIINSYSDFSV